MKLSFHRGLFLLLSKNNLHTILINSSVFSGNKNTAYADPYNPIYSFATSSINLYVNSTEISGWPGKTLNLTLHTQDELGHPSGALIYFDFNSKVSILLYL